MEKEIELKDGELDTFNEFRKKVLKLSDSRHHKISKSWGIYDAYKFLRKRKWVDIG